MCWFFYHTYLYFKVFQWTNFCEFYEDFMEFKMYFKKLLKLFLGCLRSTDRLSTESWAGRPSDRSTCTSSCDLNSVDRPVDRSRDWPTDRSTTEFAELSIFLNRSGGRSFCWSTRHPCRFLVITFILIFYQYDLNCISKLTFRATIFIQ